MKCISSMAVQAMIKNTGKLTRKNSSTVDYVIASVHVFEFLKEFDIIDFCNLCSDLHSPMSFSFSHCSKLLTKECTGEI
jgi:hypothetical protein